MKLKVLCFLGIVLLATSCSVEKMGISPTANLISNEKKAEISAKNFGNNIELIKYSSEITNALEQYSFPQKEVNKEISDLKFYVQEYLYAIREYNTIGREKAFYKYEQAYKKAQKQKHKLREEEQEILNRFLVNIKTNMSLIENLKDQP